MNDPTEQRVLRPVDPQRSGAMRRVLICLDGSSTSEECLPVAVALAKCFDSDLELVHVLESESSTRDAAPPDAVHWLIARAEAEEYLAGITTRLSLSGLRCKPTVLEGHVAEQIRCFAERERSDLIVMSSQGEKGVTEWSFSQWIYQSS